MSRGIRRSTRRRAAAVAVAGLALVLAACQGGGSMDPEQLFAQAKKINTSFKHAVGQVQLRILDDAWTVEDYGDIPGGCGKDGYEFTLGRATPDGWRIGKEPLAAARELGEWMDGEGWTDVALRTYSDGIGDVVVRGRAEARQVGEIVVTFNPGKLFDTVTVRATSACTPGSWTDLADVLIPGFPTAPPKGITRPETERPDATPLFGFNADGTPR